MKFKQNKRKNKIILSFFYKKLYYKKHQCYNKNKKKGLKKKLNKISEIRKSMKKSEIKYYNNLAKNPVEATIESIVLLIQIGKKYKSKNEIIEEIKNNKLYKDKKITNLDIKFIINNIKERGLI